MTAVISGRPPMRSAAPEQNRRPVAVAVRSSDPLAVTGVRALLAGDHRLHLVEDDDLVTPAVLVQIEARLTSADLARLRDLRASGTAGQGAVLAVTDDGLADDDLLIALEAGVSGLLRRGEAGRAQLAGAALALAEGAVLLPPRMQGLLVRHLRRVRTEVLDPNGLTLSGLTARERDVLRLVADGLDTDEIADRLAFSPRTVKYVLTHLMNRYGLRSRTHAVAYAVRVGAI